MQRSQLPILAGLVALPGAALAQPYAITAFSVSCGGSTAPTAAGPYTLRSTIGDPLAAPVGTAGPYSLGSGFQAAAAVALCYPNCDGSTIPPVLNVQDFACFLNRFAAGSTLANCDGSTTAPVLNVQDFACFLNRFAAGCP